MSFQLRVSLLHKQPQPQPSKELTVVQHQPLSLQQLSINCIITNLEKYPPDMLALLPLHFRRELLLLLPPADLFQLEQTKVVEGIDMENEVWKGMSKCYDYKVACRAHLHLGYARPLSRLNFGTVSVHLQPHGRQLQMPRQVSAKSVSWRDHFVLNVVSFLFSMKPIQLAGKEFADVSDYYASQCGYRNYIVFLQLLFCKKFSKLKELTDAGGFPLQVFGVTLLPSRYSRFFTTLVSLSEWLQFLLENCHIQPPKTIKVDLDQVNFEIAESLFAAELLQHFLTNVDDVRLFMKSQHEGIQEATSAKVMQLCDMLAQCHLQSISMTQNVIFGQSVCVIRKVTDRYQFNSVMQKCFLQPQFVTVEGFQPLTLFRYLKRINIECTNFRTDLDFSTLCSLVVYVQNSSFESISVTGVIVKYDEHQLETMMLVLESSFTAPVSSSCSLISLCNMRHIPFSFLFWLMKSFHFSPSTVAQMMVVSSCEIDYSAAPSLKALEMVPVDTDSKKSLHLTNITLEYLFIDALSYFPSLVLDELHLEHTSHMGYHHLYSITTSMLATLFHTLYTIPVCRIKSLSIQLVIANVQREFDNNQRKFKLESCDSKFIAALMPLAKKLPETAVSFQCGIISKNIELLLACLHNEWKKNGANVPLNQLFIHLSGSLSRSPDFRSSLEKSLMMYPIHDIARNVDIREFGNPSSIFDDELSKDGIQ